MGSLVGFRQMRLAGPGTDLVEYLALQITVPSRLEDLLFAALLKATGSSEKKVKTMLELPKYALT